MKHLKIKGKLSSDMPKVFMSIVEQTHTGRSFGTSSDEFVGKHGRIISGVNYFPCYYGLVFWIREGSTSFYVGIEEWPAFKALIEEYNECGATI